MKLVGKVPVEPLDDERLTNIERSLVVQVSEMAQRPRGMRAPWRLLAFAGMAMAVLVAGFVGWRLRGDGVPVVAPPRPDHVAMKAGALDLGDAQITGKDFTVTRSPGRTDIEMVRPGKLDLHVDHKPDRLFVVTAGGVEIEDVGTRFTVDFDGKNVDVRVTEGEVKIKHAGKELAVTAGNAWTIELGPITIAALDDKQALVAQAQLPNPVDVVGAAGTGSGAVRSGNSGGASGGAGGSSGSGSGQGSPRKPGTSNARKALETAGYEPPPDAGTEDPKAAIASYLDRLKSMPEGEDKALLLYGIAVMQHRSTHDSAAKHTISGVLKRQGGPAYQKSLWLNVRITCLKAFDDECRIAAHKYLAKFESGRRAGVTEEILKEISRAH